MPRLANLLSETPDARLVAGSGEVDVRGICHDSRRLQPGDLFVAISGQRVDARQFIPDAVVRGAAAVVAESPPDTQIGVPVVLVPNARAALADLAAALHGHPSRAMRLVGVTGTDGKTTVARLIGEIAARAGRKVGWLTTVDVRIGDEVSKNRFGYTTPDSPEVQAVLARMRSAGVEVAVLEASSHALALERLRGCRFEVAVFTNLAPEHLNFHGSFERYLADKARLFTTPGLQTAILNADDSASERLAALTPARVWRYALERAADLRAEEVCVDAAGASFSLSWSGDSAAMPARLHTRFPARFNVANWLAACLATAALGIPATAMERAAREVVPPPGRLERIAAGQPFDVVVDFSHTPQALEAALRELRAQTPGRLLVAFGHAGERDQGNRPRMGEAAARYSDYFVITTDDPEDERPEEIARAVALGATALGKREGRDFAIILDRREAFRHLFERAGPGDCVLLAGRGHEDFMPVAGEQVPFNDADVARALLREMAP